ncbi:hypothetical protein J3A65_001946 [Rhizobium sp. PvP014]|nr:hypothetical protein [Rhizobium sp. PvP014]MBP2528578.1 hypothetical protein [Rhizobium sp. PvP099]
MDREQIEPILASMTESLERGAFPELSFQIDFYGPLICACGNDDSSARLTELCVRAKSGFDFEKKYGRWSLLKHDHTASIAVYRLNPLDSFFSFAS